MLSPADVQSAVDILHNAELSRKQAPQLSGRWPGMTLEDSYAISMQWADRKRKTGEKLIGYKVGLTSKAMQRSSKINEPDFGFLFESMIIADGGKIPHANYCVPRVEIELSFILDKPLCGPGIRLADVMRATEFVIPSIEIVDARIQDPRMIVDTVADNGASASIVLGGRPFRPMDVDLRWLGGILSCNGEIEETGLAAGVLGHPAMGVAWLANKLGSLGITLEAGHLILTGSFTRVAFAKKGDVFHADFGPGGTVSVQFV